MIYPALQGRQTGSFGHGCSHMLTENNMAMDTACIREALIVPIHPKATVSASITDAAAQVGL